MVDKVVDGGTGRSDVGGLKTPVEGRIRNSRERRTKSRKELG